VFVLRTVEQQNSDVITTFDHTFAGVRYIHTIQDTLVLSQTARRDAPSDSSGRRTAWWT